MAEKINNKIKKTGFALGEVALRIQFTQFLCCFQKIMCVDGATRRMFQKRIRTKLTHLAMQNIRHNFPEVLFKQILSKIK